MTAPVNYWKKRKGQKEDRHYRSPFPRAALAAAPDERPRSSKCSASSERRLTRPALLANSGQKIAKKHDKN
ncbi:hypothetical protein [Hydrocarboniphaga sp.]|uniref:hypothetical protein n=1 Tax=Hydrocarboniphaga sp. TaxID=2033016 RepID=UPI002604B3B8|nr:hypothetical protein [Hydrocarboniphaga sp.]